MVWQSFMSERRKEAKQLAQDTKRRASTAAKETKQNAERIAKETKEGAEKLAKDTEMLFAGKHDEDESAPLTTEPPSPTITKTERDFVKECSTTPAPIKDHMPHWYLSALEKLKEKEDVIQLVEQEDAAEEAREEEQRKRMAAHQTNALPTEHAPLEPLVEEC